MTIHAVIARRMRVLGACAAARNVTDALVARGEPKRYCGSHLIDRRLFRLLNWAAP
jgi:hypothetical protein